MTEKAAIITPETKAREFDLWKQWKQDRDPMKLGNLLDSFAPAIHGVVRKFETVPLPPSTISAEAKRQAVNAFETYNPKAGAGLGTHVHNYLQKVNRFVYEHQNVGRIPEHRITQIGTFKAVKEELRQKLGREPSAQELADDLAWSLPEIERMERELRREVPETALQDIEFTFNVTNDAQRILSYIYYELSPKEKLVFEHLTGWAGKPKLTEDEIALRVGLSRDRVKKYKAQIAAKIRERMP